MVPLLARNQMWGPEQRRRALEQAVPIGQAQAVPIYRPGAQGRSIMGNNVIIWLLLPILTYYCLFEVVSTYYRPPRKRVASPWRSIIGRKKH